LRKQKEERVAKLKRKKTKRDAKKKLNKRREHTGGSFIDVNNVLNDVFGIKAEESADGGVVRNLVESLRDNNASRNFSKLRGSRIQTVNDASILDAVQYAHIQKVLTRS